MDNNKLLLAIACAITLCVTAFIAIDQCSRGGVFGNKENWQWSDQWGNNAYVAPTNHNKLNLSKTLNPNQSIKPKPEQAGTGKHRSLPQVIPEALKLAEEKNMKSGSVFHASWCKWCNKMEQESLVIKM